ncbi:GNAT family N-acetyltransferase [Myroides sp. NP-2]|uniref:GNAT family N-acetyltransferase n=1 Tax=Myroides sp. NP-2 TaxID=2759945 RepID=UPI0015FBBA48|nr:GNAT family N-acetyltransferase [Myroides sp. NP-2]MBB1151070.1 GNAT family N-acetyltransferase [Myroides sp. NP-2]
MKNNPIAEVENYLNQPVLTAEERERGDLFLAITRGECNWSNLLLSVETASQIAVLDSYILPLLLEDYHQTTTVLEREVQLRLLRAYVQLMGKDWNLYRKETSLKAYPWPESETKTQIGDKEEVAKYAWVQLLHILLIDREKIEEAQTFNLIQEGIKQEVLLILNMLEPQERTVFPETQQWEHQDLCFRKITTADAPLLQRHFTPAVGQYLSIDSFAHPLLVAEYIRQSQLEMKEGSCLVLLVFEKQGNAFIGCVTINDINLHTAEIGLWVTEKQQGKGYGTHLLQQVLSIIAASIPTKKILYTVEKENQRSINLCEKFGFQYTRAFILEPTPLKNKYREMIQYTKSR